MDISSIGKWIAFLGLGIAAFGLILWIGGKWGLSVGKLPGDLRFHTKRVALYFPVITSLLLSLFLTIIVNLVIWLFRK